MHDFHATFFHLLWFDHTQLTFRHTGGDLRPTDVADKAIHVVA